VRRIFRGEPETSESGRKEKKAKRESEKGGLHNRSGGKGKGERGEQKNEISRVDYTINPHKIQPPEGNFGNFLKILKFFEKLLAKNANQRIIKYVKV
jgi:hypothetical protein